MSASPETGVRPEVRGITVLFDPDCPVCRAARSWMQLRRPLVRVQFVPVGSDEARRVTGPAIWITYYLAQLALTFGVLALAH